MITEALQNIRPGSKWYVENNTYEGITWLPENTQTKPSKAEVEQEISRLESLKYRQQRAAEYPSLGDQLDDLFKAGMFSAEMTAQIQAVKDKYPKA